MRPWQSNQPRHVGRVFGKDSCRFVDQASRSLCGTDENAEALTRGKWLSHESCWCEGPKASIKTGQPCTVQLEYRVTATNAGGGLVG